MHPEAQLARAIPNQGEAERERSLPDDGFKVLRPYFREIGRIETLAPEQEVALAKAVEDYTRAMRREILSSTRGISETELLRRAARSRTCFRGKAPSP